VRAINWDIEFLTAIADTFLYYYRRYDYSRTWHLVAVLGKDAFDMYLVEHLYDVSSNRVKQPH
jgi:hypothetical protein